MEVGKEEEVEEMESIDGCTIGEVWEDRVSVEVEVELDSDKAELFMESAKVCLECRAKVYAN